MLEEDGTEVDEDVDITDLAGSTFILLGKGQCWWNASSVTATPTPLLEPSKPIEAEPIKAPSEHHLTGSANTSMTF